MKKRDLILIAVILLTGCVILLLWQWWFSGPAVYAEITTPQSYVVTVYLDRDRVFSVDGLPNVVFEVNNGRIGFIKSDCPDQVCVNTGFLDRTGQMAACLPNRVLLHIMGENGDGPDTFAR